MYAPDKRGGQQLHKHALRAILKKPLAVFVGKVIALYESDQFVVLQTTALGLRKIPQCLGLVISHVPVTALV
jgi:hypothetical protein